MRATFRFHGPLEDFLPRSVRGAPVPFEAPVAPSVKDALESLGPPHVEVLRLLVNGEPAGFGRTLADGDVVDAHADAAPGAPRTAPPAPEPLRFVLDVHLRRLAVHLRLLGFDATWWAGAEDADLAETSARERRVLLTRDLGLLKRAVVVHGRFVRATDPRDQLHEVAEAFDLGARATPFTRCLRCGHAIEPVEKTVVLDRLHPGTARTYDEFRICRRCDRVFWRGAHFHRLATIVRGVLPHWTVRG